MLLSVTMSVDENKFGVFVGPRKQSQLTIVISFTLLIFVDFQFRILPIDRSLNCSLN